MKLKYIEDYAHFNEGILNIHTEIHNLCSYIRKHDVKIEILTNHPEIEVYINDKKTFSVSAISANIKSVYIYLSGVYTGLGLKK